MVYHLAKGILFHTLYDQDDEHSFSYIVQVGFLLGAIGCCHF